MEDACGDISVDQCQGWICHAKSFFPRCMNNDNIHCDVDEYLYGQMLKTDLIQNTVK